jgi:hypothetical protein
MNQRNYLTYPVVPTSSHASMCEIPDVSGRLLKYLFGAICLGMTFPALAGTTADSLIPEITTSETKSLSAGQSTDTPPIKLAGRTNTLLDDVGSAVSVISGEDIESKPETDIADIMKSVPVVTKGPRPGGFVIPPGPKAEEYPGQYSFWDFATGKNRTTKPVQPYAPFALQTTPASDISFSYLDKVSATWTILIMKKISLIL